MRPCNVSVDAGRLNIGADDIWLSVSAPTVQRVKRCSEQKGSKSNTVLRPVSVQMDRFCFFFPLFRADEWHDNTNSITVVVDIL